MKVKGLWVAAGVIFALSVVFLASGDFQAFGGAVLVATILVVIAMRKGRQPNDVEPQPAGDPVVATKPVVSQNGNIKVVAGEHYRTIYKETVSHFLFIPIKKKEMVKIESDFCPIGRTFGEWHEKVHLGAAQSDRFERAGHEFISLKDFEPRTGVATICGSSGHEYTTTLDYCSCPDFEKRSKPCKHIYFLAMQMGYSSDEFYDI